MCEIDKSDYIRVHKCLTIRKRNYVFVESLNTPLSKGYVSKYLTLRRATKDAIAHFNNPEKLYLLG